SLAAPTSVPLSHLSLHDSLPILYPVRTEIVDDTANRLLIRRFAEELAADDRALVTCGLDLFHEALPRVLVRFLVAEHGRASHELLGSPRRLVPPADVSEVVACQIFPGQFQRPLDRGRPALVRPDVQDPGATRATVPAGGHCSPPG